MRYDIKGLHGGKGGVATLSLDASDDGDAAERARRLGYVVLSVRPANALDGLFAHRSTRFQLRLFNQELLSLLEAGLPLVEAMETLCDKEHRPDARKVMERVIRGLYEGQTFSAALQQLPEAFPALYVATVKASERTGDLPDALSRYVAYQGQVETVRKKIVSASIYPLLLIVAGSLVTLFLLGYVVPRFATVYEGLGSALPLFSRLLLAWGQALQSHAWLLLAGLACAVALLVWGLSRPALKRWVGDLLWQLPAVGERMRIYQLARFYRTVGMLLRGGTPVVTALQMVSGLLQPALRERLARATRDIREGQSLSHAMEAQGLATPVAQRMLRVGEGTGRMGEMMERIATFYDEEMARWVEWFTRLFEPILMAFIGIAIGLIVVLMYMPIFELAGSIQ